MIKSENFESMNGGNVYCNCCIDTFYELLQLDMNPSVAFFVASIEDEEKRNEMVDRIKHHKEEMEWEEEKHEI